MLPVMSPVDALLGNTHVITKLTLSPDVLVIKKIDLLLVVFMLIVKMNLKKFLKA